MKGSHIVNVFGKEDLTNAASMDQSVDPLSKDELLDNVCDKVEGEPMFPIEIANYEQRKNAEDEDNNVDFNTNLINEGSM